MLIEFDTYYIDKIQEKDAWSICDFCISNQDRLKAYFPKTLEQNLNPTLSGFFVIKMIKNFNTKETFLFTIKEKNTHKLIGLIYIKELDWIINQGEFAYCIDYNFNGQKIMSKVVKHLSKYAFTYLGLERLQIIVYKENRASVNVAINNNFTWQKTLIKEFTPPNSAPLDMELYEKYKTNNMKNQFFTYIQKLQDRITAKLEAVDGKAKFQEDLWDRPEGGGGRTRVIENGNVFEKGGVNISGVHGKLPDSMQKYFGVEDADFFACGLSIVLHPKNPMIPTVHANWRYFEMYDKEGNIVDQWFGGGQDLTPYYLFEEDAKHFHNVCKEACDKHNPEFYPKYKARCDEYFYNEHRNEARGIGGLFYDYCKKTEEMSMQDWYNFETEVGNSFLEAYVPIVEKRKNLEYTKEQRDWQEIRRGRYVEFNLVHDKGTLFGLKTNGRIESILMSLPPHVQWVYDHNPEPDSEEAKLVEVLKKPIDWI